MVQIKIKGLKDGLHVFAQFDEERIFLEELEKRLMAISLYGKVVEAFFHIPTISDHGLSMLLRLCQRHQILIKGFDEEDKQALQIKEATLYNGQSITLSQDTLWIGLSLIHIFSHEFFMSHTKAFYDFYFHEMVYEKALPNPAHIALAKLEEQLSLIHI